MGQGVIVDSAITRIDWEVREFIFQFKNQQIDLIIVTAFQ